MIFYIFNFNTFCNRLLSDIELVYYIGLSFKESWIFYVFYPINMINACTKKGQFWWWIKVKSRKSFEHSLSSTPFSYSFFLFSLYFTCLVGLLFSSPFCILVTFSFASFCPLFSTTYTPLVSHEIGIRANSNSLQPSPYHGITIPSPFQN